MSNLSLNFMLPGILTLLTTNNPDIANNKQIKIMKMKTVLSLLLLMLVGVSSCFEYNIYKEQYRTRKNIDFDWNFKLGDFPGAENIGYNDSEWRLLDLPHDWSIEGEYDENNEAGIRGAYLPCGIGWYRKSLEWNKAWKGKKVFIQFDGVYMNSEVWINGTHLGKRPYGYIGFAYDLTPYLKKGNNVIAVRVDNSKVPSSRWYTGSGIYRHVWLLLLPMCMFLNGELLSSLLW